MSITVITDRLLFYDTPDRDEPPAIISAVRIIGDYDPLTARGMNEFQSTIGRVDIYHHADMAYRRLADAASAEKYQVTHLRLGKRNLCALYALETRCRTQCETELTVNMTREPRAIECARTFRPSAIATSEITLRILDHLRLEYAVESQRSLINSKHRGNG